MFQQEKRKNTTYLFLRNFAILNLKIIYVLLVKIVFLKEKEHLLIH